MRPSGWKLGSGVHRKQLAALSCDPVDRRSDSLLLLRGFNGTLCGALLPSPGETLSRLSGLVHSDALPAPVWSLLLLLFPCIMSQSKFLWLTCACSVVYDTWQSLRKHYFPQCSALLIMTVSYNRGPRGQNQPSKDSNNIIMKEDIIFFKF